MKAKKLELSPRLLCVCEMVRRGACIADIGTDHAFVPIYLVQSGRIRFAIASDVALGPLSKAREMVCENHMEDKIHVRLSDGLAEILPDEAEDIIISGMGGETILSIIDAAPWLQSPKIRLILQPMTMQAKLRKGLLSRGFYITDEKICREGFRIYQIIAFEYDGQSRTADPLMNEIGPIIYQNRAQDAALFSAYLEQRIRVLNTVISGKRKAGIDVSDEQQLQNQFLKMREECCK